MEPINKAAFILLSMRFADTYCPWYRVNHAAGKAAVNNLGFDIKRDLLTKDILTYQATIYIQFEKNKGESCAITFSALGPNGHIAPGVILLK